ncbi:TetR/AcrR family transcriptional regulator [Erythrobacter crassostreae]|uniref:TetR/AcrR family transcriptional regulator n=1 Tax=Erythrobacter crassostreae TaxID=2828328 RepID=A0A9X1JQG9_9SPHN|nr:TetR/AcrR family transcriptional regulator [Erythrobacter crassostrea]MBV7260392.1 TetR/AcrR family transcriptional regulator [Erythrobacter crassostrea]
MHPVADGSAGRRTPTQDRAIASRAAIVKGAKRLLNEDSIADFSMRKLAQASGVGLGTIYDYFPSWTDIVRVLLDQRFELRREILTSTLDDIPREKGLVVFVPAYLERLSQKGFWQTYDIHLRGAADADPALKEKFDSQERQIAQSYIEQMKRAGSNWADAQLLQMATVNMSVSQMLIGNTDRQPEEQNLQLMMVANMILANLKMALRPRNAKEQSHR